MSFLAPDAFSPARHSEAKGYTPALLDAVLLADPGRLAAQARRAGFAALALWLLPVALLTLMVPGTYADVALFLSKMAVVTLGGAYAVLAYVAQEAVGTYDWLSGAEMLTGRGLAETTPGPLILVLQFVDFLAGFRAPESLTSLPGGVVASVLVLWVTFAPWFAFVFLGAPVVERLQATRALASALSAITAAVVGVVADLALWFGLHVLSADLHPVALGPVVVELPVLASLDWRALLLAALAAACLFRLKLGVLPTLAVSAAAGVLIGYLAGP